MLRSVLLKQCHKKAKDNLSEIQKESSKSTDEIFKFLDQCV